MENFGDVTIAADDCVTVVYLKENKKEKVINRAAIELLTQYGAGLSNMAGFTTWTPDGHGSKETCPVLDDPEPDCYCLKLNSLNIPRAVHYCLRDFQGCPIYRRFMEIEDF